MNSNTSPRSILLLVCYGCSAFPIRGLGDFPGLNWLKSPNRSVDDHQEQELPRSRSKGHS